MCGGKMVALATLCLILALGFGAVNCAGGGRKQQEPTLQECCPNMPNIVKVTSVTGCVQPGGSANSDENKSKRCVMECAFMADGLIKLGPRGRNVLNIQSITSLLTSFSAGPWVTSITAAQSYCIDKRNYTIQSNSYCSSGAYETIRCLSSVMAVYCPNLSPSDACFKRIVTLRRKLGHRTSSSRNPNKNNNDNTSNN